MRRDMDRTIRWIASAVALLSLAACGFFETRDPEEGGGEETFWQPPTSPQIIVRNLELAFENKIFNDYRRTMTADFFFRPDPADSFQISVDRPGVPVFVGWDRDVESSTAEQIAADAAEIQLIFAPPTEEIVGDNDRLLKQAYTLTINRAGETDVYQGEAWLWTRQVVNEWYIYRWEDVRRDPFPALTWGYHKGQRRL